MTLFCRKCVIFRETFIVDYANVGFFPRVVYFVVRLEVVSFADKDNSLYPTVTFFGQFEIGRSDRLVGDQC